MLTEVISKLDHVVLELALIDAFTDMCFYEGEEFSANLENYLTSVENKTNTEEHDTAFFEISMPYIEQSIMIYGRSIYEGLKEGGKPGKFAANDSKGTVGIVPAERNKLILGKDSKNAYNPTLTEAEEEKVWETIYEVIFPAAKAGIKKAKDKAGKAIGDAVKGGVASAKMFAKNLSGFKIPKEKEVALAAPEKK
jgi:hypothetical protein